MASVVDCPHIMDMLLERGAKIQEFGPYNNDGRMLDTASDESSCGKNGPHGDGAAVKRLAKTDRKGKIVSIIIVATLCVAFFCWMKRSRRGC